MAVVYSHSHVNQFGGEPGIVRKEEVKAGRVQILTPAEFMKHAITANVYTDTAMTRRAIYQYCLLLRTAPMGMWT